MISVLAESELPCPEAEFRSLFIKYQTLLSQVPPLYPPPVPRYEVFRDLDPNFSVIPTSPAEQIETIAAEYEIEVKRIIQEECTAAGFEDVNTARSYASTVNPLQAASISFVNWTAAVWVYSRDYLADVQNGIRPVPTLEEYITSLPTRILP